MKNKAIYYLMIFSLLFSMSCGKYHFREKYLGDYYNSENGTSATVSKIDGSDKYNIFIRSQYHLGNNIQEDPAFLDKDGTFKTYYQVWGEDEHVLKGYFSNDTLYTSINNPDMYWVKE